MSLDTQRSESYVSGHTEVRVLRYWTYRGQNLIYLDTPTGVRVYVTRHIDRRQSLMSLDTQRSYSYVTGHTDRGQSVCH